jgi:hypothetical protein
MTKKLPKLGQGPTIFKNSHIITLSIVLEIIAIIFTSLGKHGYYNTLPFKVTSYVGRKPILGKRLFLERKAQSGRKKAGMKSNMCGESMQGAHARRLNHDRVMVLVIFCNG